MLSVYEQTGVECAVRQSASDHYCCGGHSSAAGIPIGPAVPFTSFLMFRLLTIE